MAYKCSKCHKELSKYSGDWFAEAYGQFEGVVCKSCGKILCDKCHPPRNENKCSSCDGELLPCLANNLAMYYKPPSLAEGENKSKNQKSHTADNDRAHQNSSIHQSPETVAVKSQPSDNLGTFVGGILVILFSLSLVEVDTPFAVIVGIIGAFLVYKGNPWLKPNMQKTKSDTRAMAIWRSILYFVGCYLALMFFGSVMLFIAIWAIPSISYPNVISRILALSVLLGVAPSGAFLLARRKYRSFDISKTQSQTEPKDYKAKKEVDLSEKYVNELVDLCTKVNQNYKKMKYSTAQESQRKLEVRIREIGQILYDQGKKELMLKVHAQVASRCSYGRYLEGAWDLIGTWLG